MKKHKIISFILIGIGVTLFLIGILFKAMNWNDLWKGMISGPIIVMIGVLFLLFTQKRK